MSMNEEKQYGLILPKKQQTTIPRAGNIFGDDNGSDEEDGIDWVRKALKAESEKNKIKRQTKLKIQAALNEDPTIYQYDEVYNEMERVKAFAKPIKQEEKKPKYIQNLLKAAERRKKEQEHRIERMVQKEREAEGTMYADKESFVTSAYRAKLEEFKKMEEEDSRLSTLEAIGDVTKQQDMSGFYRHLYEQTVEHVKEKDDLTDNSSLSQTDCIMGEKFATGNKKDNTFVEEDKIIASKSDNKQNILTTINKRSRQYRQRVTETYESDSESDTKVEVGSKITVVSCIRDENKDKSVIQEPDKKKQKQDIESSELQKKSNVGTEKKNTNVLMEHENSSTNITNKSDKETNCNDKQDVHNTTNVQKENKPSIWQKRTVGPVFEAALHRYYSRKALRMSVT